MDTVSLLSGFDPQDADELVHWLEGLSPSDFERTWVSAITLYVHDEVEETREFPLDGLVRIMFAVRERYWRVAGFAVRSGHRLRVPPRRKATDETIRDVLLHPTLTLRQAADRFGMSTRQIARIRHGEVTPNGTGSDRPAACTTPEHRPAEQVAPRVGRG